jgi:uncharacterized protein (TIGR00369 family)
MSDLEHPDLTDADVQSLRRFFRYHWTDRVEFNRACGLQIPTWEPDGVVFALDYRDDLSAHPGMFHGGVVSALIDTCGSGAVMAGHDFRRGSRITTVSMSVQYLGAAPGEGVVAHGRCTRRGRSVNFAEVKVFSAASNRPIAEGLVASNIAGAREGFDRILAIAREKYADPT